MTSESHARSDLEGAELPDPTHCDLVMKGGISSGVIYPRLVCALAEKYRLGSIAGTSAGAIAAAGAAAAETGRGVPGAGFELLAELPTRISERTEGQSLLERLFAPNAATTTAHRLLVGLLLQRGTARVGSVALAMGPHLLPGLVPGLTAFAWVGFAYRGASPAPFGLALVIALLGLALWTVLGALPQTLSRVKRELECNGFGLTTGYVADDPHCLSTWLDTQLSALAGKSESSEPLRIGDLADDVEFKSMTTNLTQGRPYSLPFLRPSVWMFSRQEMLRYFPERVVRAMIGDNEPRQRVRDGGVDHELYTFPDADALPLVVAVRMSLSFPVLVSAVPLWAVQYRPQGQDNVLRRTWFTDGGLCANLPLHFFDAAVPSRPTFAINLAETDAALPWKDFFRPDNTGQGHQPNWHGIDGLVGFFGRIISCMQGWHEETQLTMPGYRDRITTIYQAADEGGLNLNMDPETIERLAERGRSAGQELVDRFDWPAHRWTRLRNAMWLLVHMSSTVRQRGPGIFAADAQSTSVYPLSSKARRDHAAFLLDDAIPKLSEDIGERHNVFGSHAFGDYANPRPMATLRMKAEL